MRARSFPFRYVLGTRVDATTYEAASEQITKWAQTGQSRYVCAANVHMIMEAYDNTQFRQIVNSADLVTSDGMPLVWVLQQLGISDATRVYGPDLMLSVCRLAEQKQIPVGIYGGHEAYRRPLLGQLQRWFPRLPIVFSAAPPGEVSPEDDERFVREFHAAGARILFVGLGCPRQERWMLEHKGRIPATMIGVGAAFDFFSGRIPQAPPWMQQLGLEWCYRIIQDPKRLWRRYLIHNPRFLVLIFLQFMGWHWCSRRRCGNSRRFLVRRL